jgi:hypothetical protein
LKGEKMPIWISQVGEKGGEIEGWKGEMGEEMEEDERKESA